ncbi:hypothetical protein ACIBFB_07495 [Nocardiopsis sp. NPDC050513]|uniref:hypothetical protein n=1 Tax=Nocardiopsis sp. NPDC050513 TaxID=3364338 RepID=UPI00379B7AE7
MPAAYATPATEERAAEVRTMLADRGQHRAPGVPDPFIAAAAERAGQAVLHRDKDCGLVAGVTAQPVERFRAA